MSITDRFSRMLDRMKVIKLAELKPAEAFAYIASQDPGVSLRFYIPVPNWLADLPSHPAIQMTGKGEQRFHFINQVDRRVQAVRIDGSGVVIINGIKPEQAQHFLEQAQPLLANGLHPADLEDLLAYAKDRLGLVDFYHGSAKDVQARMHPYVGGADTVLGAWLPNPQESSAVYVPGQSRIGLIGGGTQNFLNGAYVSFPSLKVAEIAGLDTKSLEALLVSRQITPRAVEASVFERQNTTPDGQAIRQGVVAIGSPPRP